MGSDAWFNGAVSSSEWGKGSIGLSDRLLRLLPALPEGMHYDVERMDETGPVNHITCRVVVRIPLDGIDLKDME